MPTMLTTTVELGLAKKVGLRGAIQHWDPSKLVPFCQWSVGFSGLFYVLNAQNSISTRFKTKWGQFAFHFIFFRWPSIEPTLLSIITRTRPLSIISRRKDICSEYCFLPNLANWLNILAEFFGQGPIQKLCRPHRGIPSRPTVWLLLPTSIQSLCSFLKKPP